MSDPTNNINHVPLLTAYMPKPGPLRKAAARRNGYMPGEAAPWAPAAANIPAGLNHQGLPSDSIDILDYIPKIKVTREKIATGVVCSE